MNDRRLLFSECGCLEKSAEIRILPKGVIRVGRDCTGVRDRVEIRQVKITCTMVMFPVEKVAM
jgi:hypothetical protein